MKNFMISLFAVLLLAGCCDRAEAGLFTEMTTMGQKVVDTKVYKLDSAGMSNLRVYEWTPLENPDMRCVFVAGSKKGGTACYPVKK